MTNRMRAYTLSTEHIVGSTFALAGPALALTGVLGPVVALVLTPALYATGAAIVHPRKHTVHEVAGLDARDVKRRLAAIRRRASGKVPYDIVRKIDRISTQITEMVPRAKALGGPRGEMILARSVTDYLPEALQAYLDLPRAYADHHVVADGKTPLKLLSDQLDLLSSQLEALAHTANRSDTDRLLVHGRFLADKFGTSDLSVEGDDVSGRDAG